MPSRMDLFGRLCQALRPRSLPPLWRVQPLTRSLQLEAFEDRLLYSAAPAPAPAPVATEVVVVAPVEGAGPSAEAAPPPLSAAPDDLAATESSGILVSESATSTTDQLTGSTLIVVDPSVPDYETLLDLLTNQQSGPTEILVLDSQRDGLAQIAERLEQLGQTGAIHILSHGDEAGLHLGSNWLSVDTIGQRANTLAQWQPFLTADADVLFYGCDLAANATGQEFLRTFGELTGTDVAASTDATGAALLGGDWNLEYQFGAVETPSLGESLNLFEWNGLLTTNTYQHGVSSYSGTQDSSINSTVPGTSDGSTTTVSVGGALFNTGLIRFDSLFGNGPGQIPLGSTIHSASLRVNVTTGTSVDSTISLHRVLASWSESSTWNTLGSGLSRDNVEVATVADAIVTGTTATGIQTITGLEESLQAWSAGAANNGWALYGDNATAWTFTSSEGATVSQRPMLIVDYTAPVAVGTQISTTGEVRVNPTTTNTQTTATSSRSSHDAVGIDANGNYVIVWTSAAQDGSGAGVYAQRYNSRGVALGTEFRVNELTTNDQLGASVAMKSDGGFIVTWTSVGQDGNNEGVYARIFDSQGNGASEFRVNQTTTGTQQAPAIGVDGTGNFVIAWEGNGSGDTAGIYARRFRANGTTFGGELLVNTTTINTQFDPAIAVGQDGQFMVVWDDAIGTHGRRFNSSGVALDANDLLLHVDITSGNADVATNGTGAYHIVWRTTGNGDGSGSALWKMELGATDTAPQALEQVTTSTINSQTEPSIASDGNGDFIITWQGTGPGDTAGVFARKFDSQSTPQGAEFRLNATTAGSQVFVSAAMVDLDNFVAVWSGNGAGDNAGVFARASGNLESGDSLLFTTWSDVNSSGAPDLNSWTSGDIVALGEPNLTLGPNASGGLSIAGSFSAHGDGNVRPESLDILQHDVLVGAAGSSVQLFQGDVLFSVSGSESFGSLSVQTDDVVVFRPDVVGSFTSGSFFVLFDGLESIAGGAIDYLADVDLIEQTTLVGDVLLQPGDLVVADIGNLASAVVVFHPTSVGAGTTSGTVTTLFIDSEIHLDKEIVGIQVIERDVVIGGVQLREGNLLVAVNLNSTLGSNDLAVTLHDVALLDVITTSVNGPANVTASMLITGSDVYLDSGSEAVRNLALLSVPGVPPTANDETYTLTEDQVFHSANQWYDANWSSRMQLTFDNASRPENLTDFPVLVTLDANRFNYALAQSDGADLRFVDTNGQVLAYEIETWNPAGRSAIWVKVPQIDASSNTDSIWMYYGNNTAPAGQNPTAVWSNGYVGVWHLNGDPSGSQTVQDSSSSNVDGTSIGMDATNQIIGPIGGALNFNGTNEAIRINSTASDPTAVDPSQLTIEAWANSTGDSGTWERIVNRRNLVVIIPFESYGLATSSSDHTQVVNSTGTPDLTGTTGSLPEDRWRYLTGVLSGSTSSLYVDGTLNATQTGATSLGSSDDDITIGAGKMGFSSTLSQYWTGGIDEVRLSNVARSAAWTAAQYASMTDTFIIYGERQTVAGLLDNDHSAASGRLTVSLVDLSDLSGVATAVVLDDGQFTFTPGESMQTLAAGQTATKRIDYTVADTLGNTAQATATIIVQGVNDAPVINTAVGPLTLTSVLEDTTNPPGDTVATIITSAGGTLITDVDSGAVQGIAVIAVDTTHGTWQYSVNGTTWLSLTGVSNTNATLLNTASHVRFIPTASFSGPAGAITFRAWDQTSGTNGLTGVNVSVNGGSTAFSAQVTTASISVTPLNDPPVIVTNIGLAVAEGGSGILSITKLAATDPDNTPGQLVYTLSSELTHGRIERVSAAGTAITTFTQAEINGNAIRYVHDGSETTSDGFGFSLSDGAATVTESVSLTVTPVNDAPVVSTQTGLTVLEGSSVVIPSSKLSTTDADNSAASLTYSVTGGLGFGHLALASAPGASITTFTQAQINSSQIIYVHSGAESTAEYFTFSVSDGALSATGTLSLTVTPVNDLPDFAANRMTISEGQTLPLTTYNLLTNDDDTPATSLVYTVNSVTEGRFEFAASPGTPITSFTQDDINNSRVRFVHNGGEAAPSASLSVTDGVVSVGPSAMLITFSNVNDPPTISTNTGVPLNEGATQTISISQLAASDPDQEVAQRVFTVVTGPVNGRLEKSTNAGVSITSFTQSDINGGIIRYVHNGGETTSDSFAFSLSDGTATVTGTFAITVTPVNDPPVMTASTITVNEGQFVILSDANLNATDPDSGSLVFTVSGVTHGLFKDLTTGSAVSSFTRAQVQAGQIKYVHDGSEVAPTAAVSVSDGVTTTSSTAISFVFSNLNDPPVILPATFTVPENSPNGHVVGQVLWSDPDLGDTHTFSIQPGPSRALFSIDAVTGEISIADGSGLSFETASSHDLLVQVSDSSGAISQATIHVNLLNVNEVPVALGFPPVSSTEDGPVLTLDLTTGFSDPESAQLSFQIVSMTNPSLFSSVQITPTGVLELMGAADANGSCLITVRATDPFGLSATTTIRVVLAAVNDVPIANPDSLATPIESVIVISPSKLLANDFDADHEALSVSITRQPIHGTLTANIDGTFTYSPEVGYSGIDSFEYTASDGTTPSAAATVSLTISSVSPAAAFISNSPSNTSNSSTSSSSAGSGDPNHTNDPSNGTTSSSTTATASASGSSEGSSSGGSFAGTHSHNNDSELLSVMPKSQDEDGLGLFLTRMQSNIDEVTSRGRSPQALDVAHRRTGPSDVTSDLLASLETKGLSNQFVIPTAHSLTQLRAILASNANQSAFAEVTKSLQSNLTHELIFEVPALAGVSLTVGYVVWMLRGGLLISSLLAQMPMWSIVDPLTVLDSLDQSDEDDESIGSLVEQGQSELEPALS